MSNTIVTTQDGPISRLMINRPDRHNSLGARELNAMQAAFDAVDQDPNIRVLMVSGAGEKTFCAGAALDEMDSGAIDGNAFQRMTDRLAAVKVPTVCVMNGNTYGGGSELALSCDFRLGVRGMRLRVPAAAIGLCYPINGIERFVKRLGVGPAKRLLMLAEEFDDEGLLDLGYLDFTEDREKLEARASQIAKQLASLAPLSVQAMKNVIEQSAAGQLDLMAAEALIKRCENSQDLAEGLRAKREKRSPVFHGQ